MVEGFLPGRAFLPGRVVISKGTVADYRALSHLHYAPGDPATWAGVWKAEWEEADLRFAIADLRLGSGRGGRNGPIDRNEDVPRFGQSPQKSRVARGILTAGERRSGQPAARPLCAYFKRKSEIANRKSPRLIGVGVLSYPTPSLGARERHLGLTGPRYGQKLAFVNANVRTISRVIVHPQFRAMGVAIGLVGRILEECPTRYVETLAAMGGVHPLFERAGMTRVATLADECPYFIFDHAHPAPQSASAIDKTARAW